MPLADAGCTVDSSGNGTALKCFAYLLHNGADAGISNSRLVTPLHVVCGNGYLLASGQGEAMVELLIHREANPNAQDADGCTALIIFNKNLIRQGATPLTTKKFKKVIGGIAA